MFSSLNLHSAGECEGHCSLPMHRYLFNQMPPVVSVEFGNAIRQGFYLGDEALSLLGLRLLLVKGFLGGGQYFLRFFIPGKHLIVTPLVSKRLKAPKQKIVDDMDGVLTALQRKMIRELLKHIDELERHIKNLSDDIDRFMDSGKKAAVKAIEEVPGIGKASARLLSP